MKFSKRRSYSSPIRYGFTRQSLALAGGTHAVALNHHRQLWRLSLADATDTGTVQDLHGYSQLYQQYLEAGDTFMENKVEHGALFAYRQGFGVLFIDQVLLFDTPHQPEPRVLAVLNPDLSVREVLARASTVAGCPSAAVWVPGTDQLAVIYEHVQFYGRGLFLAHLALCAGPAAAAYRLLAPPQTLTLGPALPEYAGWPGLDNVLDAPQLLALRQVAGEVQVATFGGHYSARLTGIDQLGPVPAGRAGRAVFLPLCYGRSHAAGLSAKSLRNGLGARARRAAALAELRPRGGVYLGVFVEWRYRI